MDTATKPSGIVLFIGNVPWEATDQEVQDAIKSASGIECDAKVSTRKDGRSRGYANTRVSEADAAKLVELTNKIQLGDRAIRVERRRQRKQRRQSRDYEGMRDASENGETSGAEMKNGGDSSGGNQDSTPKRRRNRRRRGRQAYKNNDQHEDDDDEESPQKNDRPDGKVLFFGNLPWETEAEELQGIILEETGVSTDVRISKRKSGRSRGYATARVSEEDAKTLIAASETIMIGERKMRVEGRKRRNRPRQRRPAGGSPERNDDNDDANNDDDQN